MPERIRDSSASDAAPFFDDRASRYDAHYDRFDPAGSALHLRMDVVLRLVGSGPGTVLDAGMGPGRLAARLDQLGWTVSGVDASGEMVATARKRLPAAADRLLEGRIEALPFGDASFDAVTATGVLEYSDVPRALSEISRVLRPGGRAAVSYPNPGAVYGIWKTRVFYTGVRIVKRLLRLPHPRSPRGFRPLPPPLFERMLAEAGLRSEATVYACFQAVPSPLDLLLPRLSASFNRRLEERRRLADRLATQVVFSATKP